MEMDEGAMSQEAKERATKERFDEVVMTFAKLLGRQLAREHFEAARKVDGAAGSCDE